jgi:hypothetical protein
LALTFVDDDGNHVVERLSVLLFQMRVGDGEQERGKGQRAQHGAAPRPPQQQRKEQDAEGGEAPKNRPGDGGNEFDRPAHRLLSQPLEKRRHMHLVGLVVSGERIHHEVDACPECHLPLHLAARHRRIKRAIA